MIKIRDFEIPWASNVRLVAIWAGACRDPWEGLQSGELCSSVVTGNGVSRSQAWPKVVM